MTLSIRSTLILFFVSFTIIDISAQWNAPFPKPEFLSVYNQAKEKNLIDPIIANGVFYENPYMSAVGHPFLGEDVTYDGYVVFRGKLYKGVKLKYEIFDQKLILFRGKDRTLESTILTKEFVSEFSILNQQFKKLTFNDNTQQFFEVVAETDQISCYYSWYKTRSETQNDKNFRIFSFSEQRHKDYLYFDGKFYRYKNNKSFLKLLPEEIRAEVKSYLKTERISVNKSVTFDIQNLIHFVEALMLQNSNK